MSLLQKSLFLEIPSIYPRKSGGTGFQPVQMINDFLGISSWYHW